MAMNSRRIALWAALAAASSWTFKSVAIGVAGGLDKSPFEGPLFFLGLLSFVAAVVALGVALTEGGRSWVRVPAGVGGFAVGLALTLVVDAAVAAIAPEDADRHWIWTELNLWVVAIVALALAIRLQRPRQLPAATADPAARTSLPSTSRTATVSSQTQKMP
jgi:hypothetical protein